MPFTLWSQPPAKNKDVDKFNADYLLLARTLMSPKSVSDAFGKRIGKRYIALQITVVNRNPDYQWLISDGAVNLGKLLAYMNVNSACRDRAQSLMMLTQQVSTSAGNTTLTSSDLTVLRGVAEKGQLLDSRNFALRSLRGSGTIAAGLLGVTTFGPAFAPAVAAFNGPLISAYETIFPDQTVNQINRLNDSAYAANTVVGKQQARVLVVFIPASHLLDKTEEKKFFKDPNSVYSGCVDLRLLDAAVDGHFITKLDVSPSITSVSIAPAESAKFASDNFKVAGVIVGQFLDGAALSLVSPPPGLSISMSGEASETRIHFELASLEPLAPNSIVSIQAKKDNLPATTFSLPANFSPSRPAIAAGGVKESKIKQGESKRVIITGSGFLPGATLDFADRKGLGLGDLTYISNSELRVDIRADLTAAEGPREFVVRTVGGASGIASITVEKK